MGWTFVHKYYINCRIFFKVRVGGLRLCLGLCVLVYCGVVWRGRSSRGCWAAGETRMVLF